MTAGAWTQRSVESEGPHNPEVLDCGGPTGNQVLDPLPFEWPWEEPLEWVALIVVIVLPG